MPARHPPTLLLLTLALQSASSPCHCALWPLHHAVRAACLPALQEEGQLRSSRLTPEEMSEQLQRYKEKQQRLRDRAVALSPERSPVAASSQGGCANGERGEQRGYAAPVWVRCSCAAAFPALQSSGILGSPAATSVPHRVVQR